mgnify:CR=1 FL=1
MNESGQKKMKIHECDVLEVKNLKESQAWLLFFPLCFQFKFWYLLNLFL